MQQAAIGTPHSSTAPAQNTYRSIKDFFVASLVPKILVVTKVLGRFLLLVRHFLPVQLVDGHIVEWKIAVPGFLGPSHNGGVLLDCIVNGRPLDVLELVVERIASEVNSGALFVGGQIGKILGVVGNLFGGVPSCDDDGKRREEAKNSQQSQPRKPP